MREIKKWFVRGEKGLKGVRRFIKELGANTYSYSSHNYIAVGYDDKPDSDWGNYTKLGGIVVSPDMFEDTCKLLDKAINDG